MEFQQNFLTKTTNCVGLKIKVVGIIPNFPLASIPSRHVDTNSTVLSRKGLYGSLKLACSTQQGQLLLH